MIARRPARLFSTPLVWLVALGLLLSPALRSAQASGPDDGVLPDNAALLQLEQRAANAELRDQCFLYTELLHGLTELAGRQLASGDEQGENSTLLHLNATVLRLHKVSGADAKRLKNAELLLEHSTRRLSDMMHLTSADTRVHMQATLDAVKNVHGELLALVFAH